MTSLATAGQKLLRKKLSKMLPPTASGQISREGVMRGPLNFANLSGTIIPIHLPYITSLAASVQLQNVIKYCTEVRKTGLAGKTSNNLTNQNLAKLFDVLIQNHQILQTSMPTSS